MNCLIEMYKIGETNIKIEVPCEHCSEKGIIDKRCNKCGGKGTHYKTIKVWKVNPKTVIIEKIDRSSEDHFFKGVQTSYADGLRYWTSSSEFFNEEDKLLHFNKDDAWSECVRRNADVKDILKIHNSNSFHDFESIIKKKYEQEKERSWLDIL